MSGQAGKSHSGARLRRLREEQKISQAALARRLDLSTSYVNQLENDHRPLTIPVLMALRREFDLAPDYFANDTDARLVGDLSEAAGHTEFDGITQAEIEELVARMPRVGKAMVSMHRRLVAATGELDTYRATVNRDEDSTPRASTPFEEVRDFFYDRKNYVHRLDMAAEEMFTRLGLRVGGLDEQLTTVLERDHDIRVVLADPASSSSASRKRSYDPTSRVITLARHLRPGQRAFQLATQLAFLTQGEAIDAIALGADGLSPDALPVARVGLANYFAGALVLPYTKFHAASEALKYDVELLGLRFEVGFETVCHRLSTLQRPGQRGVPFIFVRTDRAGNISKRQSATAFHFSRVGGSCPLWVVHDAFTTPGRIVTQVSSMPDGRSYFWLARTTDEPMQGYLGTRSAFAIGLGCDLSHADRLVYSTGVDLHDPRRMVPIGSGCKVCDRPACPQRAFPQLGRPIVVDDNVAESAPYRSPTAH
ncbi:MAG TPA: short-chain fatty acyl-CoA regulator family protein [Gordonia sp. (in: high G+C Gram-positive bacteria)]|uniref:short-chain fatty acyl-CoA regulator family protein n=1 Tax=unclassified Gordonia (in: high G+C Gram-positive bacteria) TaxID=2657482 RepID=UPI000F907DE9|nr:MULTISPECIES: short-chain fatty acyl-CoA regulator family protein [unclassified Gordonia (in: high G+C Gram-positive bacteria)]RUP35334.1 MAG: XRE family transcriptional regulator [Gordonia sp. (in: high G+C Gram-positive bacteria)]HNP55480.1 short-chain fatty acyl-CoA regulator family protein [Gordonia sp. (in: high G+C Gram-positive bacteria)]HRC50103.1 short-chain fatty acyl-CoA regulator family protein [Gordonia sp. (in: high G+C Gram-positive bacteria)]